jgi:hypothetical protein
VAKVHFRGTEVIADNSPTYSCAVSLTVEGTNTALTGSVTYDGSKTPLLTSMTPRFGQVTGGDSVTFTGTGFSATTSDYTILIDNRPCTVTAATTTSVTCTTADRPGLYPNPTLTI